MSIGLVLAAFLLAGYIIYGALGGDKDCRQELREHPGVAIMWGPVHIIVLLIAIGVLGFIVYIGSMIVSDMLPSKSDCKFFLSLGGAVFGIGAVIFGIYVASDSLRRRMFRRWLRMNLRI